MRIHLAVHLLCQGKCREFESHRPLHHFTIKNNDLRVVKSAYYGGEIFIFGTKPKMVPAGKCHFGTTTLTNRRFGRFGGYARLSDYNRHLPFW